MIAHILKRLDIPVEAVRLGRLVSDPLKPHCEEFIDPPGTPQKHIVCEAQSIENVCNSLSRIPSQSEIASLLSVEFCNNKDDVRVSAEKLEIEELDDFRQWFKDACKDDKVREWIEDVWNQSLDIYLLTGTCILTNAHYCTTVESTTIVATDIDVQIPITDPGKPHDLGAGSLALQKPVACSASKIVYAVQCQKLEVRWLSSQHLDHDDRFLEHGNRWRVQKRLRGEADSGKDVLEAELQGDDPGTVAESAFQLRAPTAESATEDSVLTSVDMGTAGMAEPALQLPMSVDVGTLGTAEPASQLPVPFGINTTSTVEPAPQAPMSVNADMTDTSDPSVPTGLLEIKHVDLYYNVLSGWTYVPTSDANPESKQPLQDDQWGQSCFVVIKVIPRVDPPPYYEIMVESPYLLTACKAVIGTVEGVSWDAIPLKLNPDLFIAFLPHFQNYLNDLCAEKDFNIIETVKVLIDYFQTRYCETFKTIEHLTSHDEITYDLLHTLFVPRSIVVGKDPVTGDLQVLQVISSCLSWTSGLGDHYKVSSQAIDVDSSGTRFIRIKRHITISEFNGIVKITSLAAYPLKFHPREAELKKRLLERGRKWASLAVGIHHMSYRGIGVDKRIEKYSVSSRVVIDRANFGRINPRYPFSTQISDEAWSILGLGSDDPLSSVRNVSELAECDLLLAVPTLYCFSLADELWLVLDVNGIQEIEWNDEAYRNLILPNDWKMLLQSLVVAHYTKDDSDDFVRGKGRGLVVNLFGPPGVGKTMSAEAISEHFRRPFYTVGANDLADSAPRLDEQLRNVFQLAGAWKAIVLIDEADVFLEQRSVDNLERNAVVAMFLRHLEYYPAILFLATNRVQTFDEAFMSRIHLSLHFRPLSHEAKSSLWAAFIAKAGIEIGQDKGVSHDELALLAERDINGWELKNAVKTATSLAKGSGRTLNFEVLTQVLDIMGGFSEQIRSGHEHNVGASKRPVAVAPTGMFGLLKGLFFKL